MDERLDNIEEKFDSRFGAIEVSIERLSKIILGKQPAVITAANSFPQNQGIVATQTLNQPVPNQIQPVVDSSKQSLTQKVETHPSFPPQTRYQENSRMNDINKGIKLHVSDFPGESNPEGHMGYQCPMKNLHVGIAQGKEPAEQESDLAGNSLDFGGYPGKYYCPRMNSMNKPSYAAICTHSPTKPVLIFVSSRRQTRLTALDLIQFAASDEYPRQFLSMSEEALQMVLSQVTDPNLRHTLQFGIGLHHAGLNDKDRSLVEELFANNKIQHTFQTENETIDSQVLVCTSTLAWGVNLPAHLVIIKGTEYYDGKAKRYVDFPITDILQMMGRAGRPQYDQHGKAVILVHEPKKSFYKKFLYEPFPVESSLREQLHDHINAEIVTGTICHKEDAVHYLTWTYLFRRLMVNPAYYGLENAEAETLNSYLSSDKTIAIFGRLVQTTFEDLEDSGCIKIDEENVESMVLGMIASQYYLSYTTVSMFGSNIGPDTSLEVFVHILSGASEYDELPVRHNEESYNEALSGRVRYIVDKNSLDDPHVKANLLFQAHFSQLELPISDYVTDLKSVLDQSIRIIQAMIDICANSGWLSASVTCMHLLQMVMQGLWFDKDSSLWMLPCMNEDLLQSLSKRGISTVQQLLDLPKAALQAMIGNFPASRFYQDLQNFPFIRMKLKVEKKDIDGRKSLALKINLEKTTSKQNRLRAFAPRFPKLKDEAWWLVLGNTSTSELYALKRVSFSDRLVTHMELPSTLTSVQGMKFMLVSDCYIGFEQEHSVEELVKSQQTECVTALLRSYKLHFFKAKKRIPLRAQHKESIWNVQKVGYGIRATYIKSFL
ncbi:unnamed protein product [Dovyalis caffra]|uniref:Helicase C-terminal domain-containing protein n=1 Tax=Dovyalis caffra TaxID=77055 RepID=A0AAV1QPC6_9ROSI|nr:unnamed protein product [Dovyalis caffra]